MRWLILVALVSVSIFSALNWRAQLQTQQKLDALSATLAERPAPAPQLAPTTATAVPAPQSGEVPRELSHVKLPPYVIEAPDQLMIEVVVKDPKTGTTDRLPTQPISGPFQVRPDGTVGLGLWGSVFVSGLTIEQATKAVREQVAKVSGKIPAEALVAVVDVMAYNSKFYYVITDFAGQGEQVARLPCTRNETVLDAISLIGGLPDVASKRKISISRAQPGAARQTLTVDWKAITQRGETATNYRLLPGDRVYVKSTAD
jgi:polysaccharide export outer membrane protein